MKIGIDFGTSYSAAAVMTGDRLQKIQFASGDQFRTAVYFPDTVPNMDDFAFTPELERQADAMIRRATREADQQFGRASARWEAAMSEKDESKRAKALELLTKPVPPNPNAIRSSVHRAIRQQWLEEKTRLARSAVVDSTRALFGDAAIDEYMSEGTGRILQSPKSLLGSNLTPSGRTTVLNIVGFILEHIRLTATKQLGEPVREAVIGRPVEFRSSLGPAGTEQAMALVREAASKAGYDDVTFLEEPVAASLGFHRRTTHRAKALIVDVGGGTTDFAFVELGGNRAPKVIDFWGLARGGTDVDLELSQRAFMPLFGRDLDGGAPAQHYVSAMMVQDYNRQNEFATTSFKHFSRPFASRLRALQEVGNTHRLARTVERTKILLSEKDTATVRLNYIEKALLARANKASLTEASAAFCRRVGELLNTIAAEIKVSPDVVFLTGGMSNSPYVVDLVRSRFPSSNRKRVDPSHGVVRGLAIRASE